VHYFRTRLRLERRNFYPCWPLLARHLMLYSPEGDSGRAGVKGPRLMPGPHRGPNNESGWPTSSKNGRIGPAEGTNTSMRPPVVKLLFLLKHHLLLQSSIELAASLKVRLLAASNELLFVLASFRQTLRGYILAREASQAFGRN
jgi:hypothetical protein